MLRVLAFLGVISTHIDALDLASVKLHAQSTSQQTQPKAPQPSPSVQKLLTSALGPTVSQQNKKDIRERALALARQLKDRPGEAETLYQLGRYYVGQGDNLKAIELYEQAIPIYQEVGDEASIAATYYWIGRSRDILGQHQLEREAHQRARAINLQLGLDDDVAQCTFWIARSYQQSRLPDRALEQYEAALAIYKKTHNVDWQSHTLNALGTLYSFLGQDDKAFEYFQKSLSLALTTNNRDAQAYSLGNLGDIHLRKNHLQRALSVYSEVLRLRRETNDSLRVGTAYRYLSKVHLNLGDYPRAMSYCEKALDIARELEERGSEALAWSQEGRIRNQLRDYTGALECFSHAQAIFYSTSDIANEASASYNIGQAMLALGDRPGAISFLKRYVNLQEQMRARLADMPQDIRDAYKSRVLPFYQHLADLLIMDGRIVEAQRVLDILKHDELDSYMRGGGSDHTVHAILLSGAERDWISAYEEICSEVLTIGNDYSKLLSKIRSGAGGAEDNIRAKQLESKLEIIRRHFTEFLKDEKRRSLVMSASSTVVRDIENTKSWQRVLKTLSSEEQRTIALYTVTSEDRFHIIIITPELQDVVTVKCKAGDLREKIFAFRTLLQSPRKDPRPLGKELYDLLIVPLEKKLGSARTSWLWSLDGALRYLPMGALWDGRQYLIERQVMSVVAPAGQSDLTAWPDEWRALAYGASKGRVIEVDGAEFRFPGLPGTALEIKGLQTILPTDAYQDANFTNETFFGGLRSGNHSAVHIATHFAFRAGNDDASFLLLGDGTPLRFSEVSNKIDSGIFDGVELLALSACETALSSEADGRDFEGFAALAQRAGVRAVLASLWAVSDDSTAKLMGQFYSNRGANPRMSKAEALRQAQLSLLRGQITGLTLGPQKGELTSQTKDIARAPAFPSNLPSYSHPYYWAPFILIGNPR